MKPNTGIGTHTYVLVQLVQFEHHDQSKKISGTFNKAQNTKIIGSIS